MRRKCRRRGHRNLKNVGRGFISRRLYTIRSRKRRQQATALRKQKTLSLIEAFVSGLPIIQNGKLVGAVTHVLINDPTTGYGIFIENMLNAAQMPQARAS